MNGGTHPPTADKIHVYQHAHGLIAERRSTNARVSSRQSLGPCPLLPLAGFLISAVPHAADGPIFFRLHVRSYINVLISRALRRLGKVGTFLFRPRRADFDVVEKRWMGGLHFFASANSAFFFSNTINFAGSGKWLKRPVSRYGDTELSGLGGFFSGTEREL